MLRFPTYTWYDGVVAMVVCPQWGGEPLLLATDPPSSCPDLNIPPCPDGCLPISLAIPASLFSPPSGRWSAPLAPVSCFSARDRWRQQDQVILAKLGGARPRIQRISWIIAGMDMCKLFIATKVTLGNVLLTYELFNILGSGICCCWCITNRRG